MLLPRVGHHQRALTAPRRVKLFTEGQPRAKRHCRPWVRILRVIVELAGEISNGSLEVVGHNGMEVLVKFRSELQIVQSSLFNKGLLKLVQWG